MRLARRRVKSTTQKDENRERLEMKLPTERCECLGNEDSHAGKLRRATNAIPHKWLLKGQTLDFRKCIQS